MAMSGQEYEGFICPYCLVGFGCQGQLQNHFLEMHSGQGQVNLDDYDEVEYVETEVSGYIRYQLENEQSCTKS